MKSGNLLEVSNLSTIFKGDTGEITAINDISFYLGKGETLGIVGESGSGKSVTSLSIMQLINAPGKIVNGKIMLSSKSGNEVNLFNLQEGEMRKYRGNEIAMIFQEPMTSLNPVFTCGYQVMEAIMLHQKVNKKEARKRTIELFNKVELPRPEEIVDSYPHQISGGQKQRVMIAMAMSCNPSILIADEPTTALDVTVQKTILSLFKQLQKETGMSVIFITHDLGVIADIADRVIVMYKGQIVEEGSVNQIFKEPKHPYTKGLLACRPPLKTRLRRLPTMSDFMKEVDGSLQTNAYNEVELIRNLSVSDKTYKERLLKVQGLKNWFPVRKGIFGRTTDYVKAVDDVSFELKKGEVLGLVGESGCGKTTLGRSILRLIEPTEGELIYDGKNIRTLSSTEMRKMRRKMQIIFQDPYSSLNPRMTIGRAINEPMLVHKLNGNQTQRKEKVIELLEKVGLKAEHYNRYPHEFSGGQRQRICIARALAVEPEFIVCDESVSALDVSVQAQVLNLLCDLRDEFGLTYIFISHDLSVVKFMCDRMIVMNKGKIIESGNSEEIYNNPKTDYTKQLIDAIPRGL